MNTGCTRRPRSIAKLITDLQAIGGDLALIAHGIEVQRTGQLSPMATTPRFDGEDIHQLANAMWTVVTFGEQLESVAKERARWRSLTPAQRRELIAQTNRRKVVSVDPLDACDAPKSVRSDEGDTFTTANR